MKIGSWILGMKMGNMGNIYFDLVFDKGAQWGQKLTMKIEIRLILMKFKPYVLHNT